MEFGKVDKSQLAHIDLSVPPDDARTLVRQTRVDSPRVGIGAPVWGARAWLGSLYPAGTAPTDFLIHYAKQMNTIELNSTHYRIPDAATIRRWIEQTPETFRFCPKFPQDLSHRRPLAGHPALLREFIDRVTALGPRLGTSFLQLSPAFAPMDLPDLKNFLAQLPRDFSVAVEVRHPAFFREHRLLNSYFEILQAAGAGAVITDVAGRRDVLHTTLPGTKAMIRFIGNELHPTDDNRMAEWATRTTDWLNRGLTELEFFVHQPADTDAPEAIARFTRLFNAASGMNLPIWQPAAAPSGTQMSWF